MSMEVCLHTYCISVNSAEIEDAFDSKPQGGLVRFGISPLPAVQTAPVAQCVPSVPRRHDIGAWIAHCVLQTMEVSELLELALSD